MLSKLLSKITFSPTLNRVAGIVALTLVLVIGTVMVVAATTVIDMTSEGAVAEYNGAVFIQGPLPTSSGTGVLDPFMRVSAANQDIVKGYNTNYRPLQYNEDQSWTEALLLSTVATVERQGVLYRELRLDINQVNSDSYLSLDELKLFVSSSPTLTNYDPTAETFSGVSYPKVWDLGDAWIWMEYDLEAGSGDSDVTFLVPESIFDPYGCAYGQPGCSSYLYLWSEFGVQHNNNDGFEEWATVVYPVVQPSKTAVPSYDRSYSWTITKDVDPSSCDLFAGESCIPEYTVSVDQTVSDSNIRLVGNITITNPTTLPDGETPSPAATITSVSDMFAGQAATVTCPGGLPQTINKGVTLTCSYELSLTEMVDGTNTATILIQGGAQPFVATAAVTFGEPTNVTGYETIDVTDDFGGPWQTSSDASWTYTETFPCSTLQSDYTNGSYSTDYPNTARITQTSQSDSENVTVTCYAPVVTKTADEFYTRDWDWTISKDWDGDYDLFAGEDVVHDYKVSVTPSYSDNGWQVTGDITIYNNHPTRAMSLTSVSDLAGGINAPVTCASLSVPADGSLTCSYDTGAQDSKDLNPFGDTNTATAVFAGANWSGNAAIAFGDPTTENDPVITVDDDNLSGESWSANRAYAEWTYTKTFACSTDPGDYENGSYDYHLRNTATINETGGSDSANVDVDCYAPVVEKTANEFYSRYWEWSISKDWDGDYDLFAGEDVVHNYKVSVTPSYSDNDWQVSGNITIYNHHPSEAMTLTSVSDLAGGINAPVTCASLSVPADGSLTCSYDTGAQDSKDLNPFGSTNTATAVFAGANWTGNAAITFGDPTWEDDPVITVDDDNLSGESWSANRAYAEWTYTKTFACSTDPSEYTNGSYGYDLTNTATINETGGSDTAYVEVDCYAPVVTKTANEFYTRTWDWTITKDYDGSYVLLSGESVNHGYLVTVSPDPSDNGWQVTGNITIYNSHPTRAMSLTSVSDLAGGISAPVTCASLSVPADGSLSCSYDTGAQDSADLNPFGGTNIATAVFAGTNWTGSANILFGDPTSEVNPVITVDDDNLSGESWSANRASASWDYSKDFPCPTDATLYTNGVYTYSQLNTATINETGQSDTANVDVTCYLPANARVIKSTSYGSADIGQLPLQFDLYDPFGALLETVYLNSEMGGTLNFSTELRSEGLWKVVETLPAGWVSNDASLECTFTVDFPASAGQTYTCNFSNTELSRVTLLKLTQGVPADSAPPSWTFRLFSGPDGFDSGSLLATDTTPPALLDFGLLNLNPAEQYTLCETDVAAGWSSAWKVDTDGDGIADTIINAYNPDADNDPAVDVGNRCVEIGFGTEVPLTPGEVLVFEVDNSYPGGEPRTPGYWKNWAACTNGGQYDTALANGGGAAGFWTLDELLNSPGFTIGVMYLDGIFDNDPYDFDSLNHNDCVEAVRILDKSDADRGKKKASDAAYNLATSLLAAKLNLAAGAETCSAVQSAVLDGQALLDGTTYIGSKHIVFDGSGDYLGPKVKGDLLALRQLALELAYTLDQYNNGYLCTP